MPSPLINVMTAAAIKASRGLLRDFGEVDNLQISRKGVCNFVTNADKRAEKVLMSELEKARPGWGFLIEESGDVPGENSEYRWIIDPLDGTHNFIHTIPYFCISIGLERTQKSGVKEIIAGVVYDPLHNEMFTAEIGKGAFLGNRRLNVSRREEFDETMIVMSAPRPSDNGAISAMDITRRVVSQHASLRYAGASALDLAYLAAGRYDALVLCHFQPWDVAAGRLLVAEAGGTLTELDGAAFSLASSNLLGANPVFHGKMLKMLAP